MAQTLAGKDQWYVVHVLSGQENKVRENILKRFKDGINAFYSFNDVERGNMLLNAGTPQEKQAPLMELIQVQEDL